MKQSPLDIRLSVIIVNWNVKDYLIECITTLKQELASLPKNYEVILVDNHSTDGSVDAVRERFGDIVYIENKENVGFAKANNQAFLRCKGKYILLLNPDTIVLNHSIGNMIEIMESEPEIGAVGGCLINSDGSFQQACGGAMPTLYNVVWHNFFFHRLLPQHIAPQPIFLNENPGKTVDIGWLSGAALMIRRSAVKYPLFDPLFFMFGEDVALCNQIRESGWRVVYTNKSIIIHHHGKSMEKQLSQDVMANLFKGPRLFFRSRNGKLTSLAYDFSMLIGFMLRWLLFKGMSVVSADKTYGLKAAESLSLAGEAFKYHITHK